MHQKKELIIWLPGVLQVGEEEVPPRLEVVMGAPQMKAVLKLDWWQVL